MRSVPSWSARTRPAGTRVAAFGVAHDDSVQGHRAGEMESADRETVLIALVETARGIEHAEAIAAVEGIDVIWVGQSDLTISLGIAGHSEHPSYRAALERLASAAVANGKALGFTVTSIDEGRRMLGQAG